MTREDLKRFTDDQLDLVPIEFIEGAIEVLEVGAKKYGRHSWEEGKHFTFKSNCDSLFHHLSELFCGLEADKESGSHPSAHMLVRSGFVYTLHKRGKL